MIAPTTGGGLKISAWAIRNPIPVTVLFLALLLAGVLSYLQLPIKQYPNVQLPMVSVTVTQNGASPGEIETQITRQVEDAVAGVSNVENVQSVVTQGASTTNITFQMGEDLQKKTDEVRTKIEQVRAQLPRDIDAPTVQRVEIDSAPIMTYAVSVDGLSDAQLSWFVDDTIARALQAEKGVAQVTRVGGVNREINVLVDPDKLTARGLTAADVNSALAGFQLNAGGGRVEIGGREQAIRILGQVETTDKLRDLTIPTSGGGYVRLADIAEVGDGSAEARGFARLNGRPVVGFQVMKTREASDVAVDDRVVKALAALEKARPEIHFTRISATVDETRTSFEATRGVLLEGMALAAVVVFFFLKDWRATLITAAAMPISLIPTFAAMAFLGFSLNVVTLLALTLVIGILVDDAIVEIENIEKRVVAGYQPYDAAMEGADAIGLAVVATTFAIVVVFAPVSFMPGIAGQFFKEFGLTISVAVLFSLVVARLLTPLMAAYLLKPRTKTHEPAPLPKTYLKVLNWSLDHRMLACAIGGMLFIGSLALLPLLPTAFTPEGDPDYLNLKIQGAPGATLEQMDQAVSRIDTVFAKEPAVDGVFATVGSTSGDPFRGGGGADLRSGSVTVLLKADRKVKGQALRERYRAAIMAIPDVRIGFLKADGQAGFQQILTGDDPDALTAAALELQRQMRDLPELADPHPSAPPVGPEIVIRPRADEAARLGVSVDAIALAARVATSGDIDANVAKLNDKERRIPIRVRLPADARADLDRVRGLRLKTASGETTRLEAVADVSFQAGPARIDRLDRQRQMTVEAELTQGATLGSATKAVHGLPVFKAMPASVRASSIGDAKAMAELFGGFGLAIFAGVTMIYGVLVLLFGSFFKPIVILSALPLAVGGAFLGLLAFHQALSIPSLIGFLMLLGLAAKNSILLVEYAIELERGGMRQRDALIEACRERARPIVMTTVAMAAGMLPTALALEHGAEFRQPMAVAVIGGLITSTLLSLVLVPVVYEFVDDFEQWLRPRLAKLVTPRVVTPGVPLKDGEAKA
ncbi:efflux RND transporter permease subunit [Caulobacter sp. BE254]|uniref:efflux RND transporter permease subunit n=1 Tax=Caulobacter sp. BE254 TaxID=2817720 RepID=UPI002860AC91|nr:efflux RND transporter permease subunit [Caulobacter sp. BE254]MDR7114715.1 HAE1 family hydrophobic/amphiphilic exporter-1 [Caulobacter sp. BE254]